MPSARKLYWQRLKHIIENTATNISDVFFVCSCVKRFFHPRRTAMVDRKAMKIFQP